MGRHSGRAASLLAALLCALLAASAGDAASKSVAKPAVDPLEGAKAALRLKEFARAATELEANAKKGNTEAQYLLASLYLNGLGVSVDLPRARALLEQAAGQKHARAPR